MAKTPDIAQIAEARAYILQMTSRQALLEDELHAEYEEAVSRLAQIILKYRNRGQRLRFTGNGPMAREVQQVMDDLQAHIDDLVAYHCIPDEAESEEEEDAVLARVHEKDHGYTYDDRRTLYMSSFLSAVAEIDYGDVYDLAIAEEAMREAVSRAEDRMELLAVNSVAIGFAFLAEMQAKGKGAIGFITYPGSDHPCSYCEDRFYRLQPMTEPKPPYHPRCRCLTVYVY